MSETIDANPEVLAASIEDTAIVDNNLSPASGAGMRNQSRKQTS